MAENSGAPLERTPLYDQHVEHGARLVPFAGYEMAVQYRLGVLKEHLHTRAAAGLFDVSHMGQVRIAGDDPWTAIERLVPGDIQVLKPGAMRYSLLTNAVGGILDDLIITRRETDLFVVVNAACKDQDIAHMRAGLEGVGEVEPLPDRALLALQGPAAAEVMARHAPDAVGLSFMTAAPVAVGGIDCFVSRSGYTGEDGFEISVPGAEAADLFRLLVGEPEVEPIGLGARDSLRLEAGLCLYGHDIDTTTTPIEAGLAWAVNKRRRAEGGFPGAEVILKQLADGPARRRVGIRPEGRAPAREGAAILDEAGEEVGIVTSGGFGPTVDGPIAMGYVPTALAAEGTAVGLVVRGRTLPAKVAKLPFVQQRYVKN